ncbi:hypothetical protein Nepgr_022623 [Nepenthes gracilis]|uniref:Uncharacterized protein n=1 Tax=Nepenthes gracilis TaxID=150966 RepID=A0AAD3T2X9_NEPGR|nr:hypothetical protein Nepgr_022623 [Nepenthes gracilis]
MFGVLGWLRSVGTSTSISSPSSLFYKSALLACLLPRLGIYIKSHSLLIHSLRTRSHYPIEVFSLFLSSSPQVFPPKKWKQLEDKKFCCILWPLLVSV